MSRDNDWKGSGISSVHSDKPVTSLSKASNVNAVESVANPSESFVQSLQENAGGSNIIVLDAENTRNLAAALDQIASGKLTGQNNPDQTVDLQAAVRSVHHVLNQVHPEQRKTGAAFMLVPIPNPPSMHVTVPSNTVSQDTNHAPFSCPPVPGSHLETSEKLTFSSTSVRTTLEAVTAPQVMPTTCAANAAVSVQHTTTKPAWCGDQFSNAINHEATVASPGLAFLAQVSSFASNEKKLVNTMTTNTTDLMGSRPDQGHMSSSQSRSFDGVSHHLDHTSSGHLTTILLDSSRSGGADCNIEGNGNAQTATHDSLNSSQDSIPMSDVEIDNIAKKRNNDAPLSPVVKGKRKKGPAPKLCGNEVCLVCGDRASGFHYNTLSCEGCKGFFRRSVIKNGDYQCKQDGACAMDLYGRRKCQKCRFDKCKAAGMREESVLSEEKVKAKKIKRDNEKKVNMTDPHDKVFSPILTPQQRSLLELLKANERRFQWPTSEDVKKVTVWVEGDDTPHGKVLRFAHFTELCILMVQLVVEFTKQLPGFLSIPRDDQIVLLKACAIEVLLLRAAKQYNKHDGTINFLNGKLYDKSSFYKAGMQVEFVDPIFKFCNSMAQLNLDETEYAILVAINTFSTDRPHIKDTGKVECMQESYVDLLRVYSRMKHPDDPLMFARILMKIVELRTLNNYHSEQIFALKVQDRKLPPLLAEIWDM